MNQSTLNNMSRDELVRHFEYSDDPVVQILCRHLGDVADDEADENELLVEMGREIEELVGAREETGAIIHEVLAMLEDADDVDVGEVYKKLMEAA